MSWAIVGILIISGVLLAGFIYTKSVSIPIVLAVVLAIVFQPAVDWLVNKGMSRAPAAAVVLIGLLVAIVGIVALVSATLVANWDEISSELSDGVSKIDDYLSNTSLSDTLGSQTSDSAGSAGSTMMSGVGSYIPYIGAFVAGGLAVLLALAHGGTSQALIMLAVVILVQNTLENIIQPKITARYVSLSPLAVLLATALGGVVAGIVGLVLAVPLAAVGKEAVRIARRPDDESTAPGESPAAAASGTS